MGKMLGTVIYNRLVPMTDYKYGFSRVHSMVDAISMVVSLTKVILSSTNLSTVFTMDIKNAFNFAANWNRIKEALIGLSVPQYFASLVENYLSEDLLVQNE